MTAPVCEEKVREIIQEETLTKEDLRAAVAGGIKDALIGLGIDAHDPIQLQQDMSFLRRLRKGSSSLTTMGVLGVFAAIGTVITTFIVIGFNNYRGM